MEAKRATVQLLRCRQGGKRGLRNVDILSYEHSSTSLDNQTTAQRYRNPAGEGPKQARTMRACVECMC